MKVLLLDNYDSFTYNLYHYLQPMVEKLVVIRNDALTLSEVEPFDAIVISPGPGLPEDAGILMPILEEYVGKKPILGICLGLQAIALHFGGGLRNLDRVIHGHASSMVVLEPNHPLFFDVPGCFDVGHYHSWVVDEEELPKELMTIGESEAGLIMAMGHPHLPVHGLQFHPESILTPEGKSILRNWVERIVKPYLREVPRINIAIDGHSACGKSTVAKRLAEQLGYIYVDSGAMYRAVALFALENGLAEGKEVDVEGLKERLTELDIRLQRKEDGSMATMLNGNDVEAYIRNMRVSAVVSPVSTIPEVRSKLVELQQAMSESGGIIMDGRDIGTVVLPNAELKIFLTASIEERARRRWTELEARGTHLTMDEVLENLRERDRIDSTREVSPLTKAEDAVFVDNSSMDADQTLDHIRSLVEQTLEGVGA